MSKEDYERDYVEEQKASALAGHNGHVQEHMSPGEYARTRITTLKPPMAKAVNPIAALRMLNREQWLFFLCGFLGWTWDAVDFFTVSLTVSNLAEQFDRPTADITWGITCALMTRSVGAITFGIASDRFGRKWPYVINMLLFIALELGTGFCSTYGSFIACRTLFGVAMGGLYGNVASTALDDCPLPARGIISGMFQQGYAFGYLLATVFARALVTTTPHGWRSLYWFAACPPVLLIAFRLCLPETQAFRQRQKVRESGSDVSSSFIREGKVALKRHWMLLVYLVLLMTGMNFASHGSQDLYPTMLQNQFNFSANAVTVTQVVANLGAICGGTTIGYLSNVFGRRLTLICACIMGAALLYPYGFISNKRVIAAAFFEQFFVQGAWGVIPGHLFELSPPALATFCIGTSYQLGNLVSSASSTIEATISERFPLPPKGKTKRYQYGKVIAIFMAAVYVYIIIVAFIGPEKLNRSVNVEDDADMEEAAGHDRIVAALHPGETRRNDSGSDEVERV